MSLDRKDEAGEIESSKRGYHNAGKAGSLELRVVGRKWAPAWLAVTSGSWLGAAQGGGCEFRAPGST